MIGKTNSTVTNIIEYIPVPPSSEYQTIEYLESDGQTYINTLLKAHSNMSAELKFQFTTVPNDGCLVGCRHTNQQQDIGKSRLYFYHYFQGHKLGYGMYLGKGSAEKDKIYHVRTRLDQGHQYQYVNDVLTYEGYDSYYINDHETFYIFALNDGDTPVTTDVNQITRDITFYTKAKLYYLKIWDGEKLVRSYVAARRLSDGELGLYDLIERVFYTNSGKGSFKGGQDIDLIISNNGKV